MLIELLSHGLDILSYYNDVVANETFLTTARDRENVIKLTEQIGYKMSNSKASRFEQVFEVIPSNEPTIIPKGLQVTTRGDEVETEIMYELEEDLVIPPHQTGLEQDSKGEYLYKGVIRQGITVSEEVIGTSRGTVDQSFKLSYPNVLDESIEVYIDDGTYFNTWGRVNSFLDSGVNGEHYLVKTNEQDESFIIFGNGLSGKIPPQVPNGIVATYRVGDGMEGNVAPNKITEIFSKPAFIRQTFNPYEAFELGEDKESNESAKIRSTAQLRTLWRAVTIFDFKDLAYELDFVRFANATENKVEDLVDIYVLPRNREILSNRQTQELNELYEERKIVGVDFRVNSPTYVSIDLGINLKLRDLYKHSDVRSKVMGYLQNAFAFGTRDFEEEIVTSDLIRDILDVEGIKSVQFTLPTEDIQLAVNEIAILGDVAIGIVGGVDDEEE